MKNQSGKKNDIALPSLFRNPTLSSSLRNIIHAPTKEWSRRHAKEAVEIFISSDIAQLKKVKKDFNDGIPEELYDPKASIQILINFFNPSRNAEYSAQLNDLFKPINNTKFSLESAIKFFESLNDIKYSAMISNFKTNSAQITSILNFLTPISFMSILANECKEICNLSNDNVKAEKAIVIISFFESLYNGLSEDEDPKILFNIFAETFNKEYITLILKELAVAKNNSSKITNCILSINELSRDPNGQPGANEFGKVVFQHFESGFLELWEESSDNSEKQELLKGYKFLYNSMHPQVPFSIFLKEKMCNKGSSFFKLDIDDKFSILVTCLSDIDSEYNKSIKNGKLRNQTFAKFGWVCDEDSKLIEYIRESIEYCFEASQKVNKYYDYHEASWGYPLYDTYGMLKESINKQLESEDWIWTMQAIKMLNIFELSSMGFPSIIRKAFFEYSSMNNEAQYQVLNYIADYINKMQNISSAAIYLNKLYSECISNVELTSAQKISNNVYKIFGVKQIELLNENSIKAFQDGLARKCKDLNKMAEGIEIESLDNSPIFQKPAEAVQYQTYDTGSQKVTNISELLVTTNDTNRNVGIQNKDEDTLLLNRVFSAEPKKKNIVIEGESVVNKVRSTENNLGSQPTDQHNCSAKFNATFVWACCAGTTLAIGLISKIPPVSHGLNWLSVKVVSIKPLQYIKDVKVYTKATGIISQYPKSSFTLIACSTLILCILWDLYKDKGNTQAQSSVIS